jgi:hypothetical protein
MLFAVETASIGSEENRTHLFLCCSIVELEGSDGEELCWLWMEG